MFGRRQARRLILAGDRARDRGDWTAAAACYEAALRREPELARVWVQLGHARKEAGAVAGAEQAYRRALDLAPAIADTHVQLGHILKITGRSDDAVDAYRAALVIDPASRPAREELRALAGDAAFLPGTAAAERAKAIARIGTSVDRSIDLLVDWCYRAPLAPADYDRFRRTYPIAPPPVTEAVLGVHLIVDMAHAPPADLRATLLSLLDQRHSRWRVSILCEPDMAEHPVESFARSIPNVVFLREPMIPIAPMDGLLVLLDAGTVLDPEALAWLTFACARTGAEIAYADHDTLVPDWRRGGLRVAPCLYPMPDRDFLAATDAIPPIVAGIPARLPAGARVGQGRSLRRDLLVGDALVAHVPRVLASLRTTPPALRTMISKGDILPEAAPSPVPRGRPEGLTIVIPTRNGAELVEAAVSSLLATATEPDKLNVVVVDNRSTDPALPALLARWAGNPRIRSVAFDEPFNWSRINNLVAASAPVANALLFVNNDTQMLTAGWDEILAAHLARDAIGAIGARLLYPDRTLQHAGVLFGIGLGSPIHEGAGAAEGEGGPLGRWRHRRAVSAVTGAFLACSRSAFALAGGFDETSFPIAFNDIDFCLRLRAGGRRVLYEPAIELIHYESRTRGTNDTFDKLLWDHGELETFANRWPAMFSDDPSYNPQWASLHPGFAGFREPSAQLILDYLDRSARPDPYLIDAPKLFPAVPNDGPAA